MFFLFFFLLLGSQLAAIGGSYSILQRLDGYRQLPRSARRRFAMAAFGVCLALIDLATLLALWV